ncbi:tetratricopeptide repeat protein [Leptolyngbya sp. CCY15150]|uniref:tetratricopeptide repeat protein n=1 Tax=Leptolyngbya sp. CCY15150 TaxID=2767772 RepID=UPI00194FF220|nr:tetratricopeptide repeat protein [Leptolyngbya sp. CCY15150]
MDVNAQANDGGKQWIAQEQHFHNYPPTPQEIVGIPHNLPYSGVAQFVGRDDDLESLHQQLQSSATVVISAVAGMGGIGKTELALQYAYQQLEANAYPGGICWLEARQDVGLQIVSFARANLGLVMPDGLDLAEQVAFCWQRWPAKPTLLILDDVQAYQDIAPFLPPPRSQFKLLLTSRSRFGSPVNNYDIQVLSAEASLELLRSLVDDGRIDQDIPQAEQLCEWLGYLPLGLELVGRYLAEDQDVTMAVLWARLQKKRLEVQALRDTYPGMTASLSVAAAFELSWERLDEDAQRVAKLLSLFAPAAIPWTLVQQCWPEWDEEAVATVRNKQLLNLHLLTRTEDGHYQLHQLLREFFATKLTGEERQHMKTALATTMIAVAKQIPQNPTLAQIQAVQAAIPHLKAVATDLMQINTREELYLPKEDNLTTVFTRIAWFYKGQGLYAEAEPWLKTCLTVVRSLLGDNHPNVATSLNNLAGLYESQGRYELAEPLLQQALELMRSLLGDNHPDVATSLNNLALLYNDQGRYELAEPLYQQALELRRSLLGDNHPDVAASLNNLATLYDAQGCYELAEPLYQQALELRRSLLGENHPDVAASLNNLAGLYKTQGHYELAEPLYQQALELRRSLLGDNHPDVATSLNNLAALYYAQGRYELAEPLLKQALELRRSLLGDNHPDVAASLNNLAELYNDQGRYELAEPLLQQALELRRSLLGENHPDVAASLNNLALLYRTQGRYELAEPLYQQALELMRSLLGDNHPNVAASLNNLAALYHAQGRYELAEPLLKQALELIRSLLGDNHPDVAASLNNLAVLYANQERYELAEPLYQQALELIRSLLGDNHPDVAASLNNLAILYANQGRLTEAEPLLAQALAMYQQRLGNQHPYTVGTQQSLDVLRQMMGRST